MSTSTDALLVYGVPLAEGQIEDRADGDPESGPSWMKYSGHAENGVGIELHCSEGYPMFFAVIPQETKTARRGYPINITGQITGTVVAYNAALAEFCKKHSLKTAGEPGWWLASWWG